MARLMLAHWMMAPAIHHTHETCSATLRENRSARNELVSEPTKLPAGMDAVMAPWV